MALDTQTHHAQLYTILATDKETGQINICSYGADGAILTSDLTSLKAYYYRLCALFGAGSKDYDIVMVTSMGNMAAVISGELAAKLAANAR